MLATHLIMPGFWWTVDTMGLVDPNSVNLPVSAFFTALQQWKQVESSVRWQWRQWQHLLKAAIVRSAITAATALWNGIVTSRAGSLESCHCEVSCHSGNRTVKLCCDVKGMVFWKLWLRGQISHFCHKCCCQLLGRNISMIPPPPLWVVLWSNYNDMYLSFHFLWPEWQCFRGCCAVRGPHPSAVGKKHQDWHSEWWMFCRLAVRKWVRMEQWKWRSGYQCAVCDKLVNRGQGGLDHEHM